MLNRLLEEITPLVTVRELPSSYLKGKPIATTSSPDVEASSIESESPSTAGLNRVGRRVMAAAHMLHYGVGIPVRRVPVVLRALTGVELSQSAITQDALRRARGAVGDAYHRLRESVREMV